MSKGVYDQGGCFRVRSKARNFPTRFFLRQNLSLTGDISDSENSKKFCLIILKFVEKLVKKKFVGAG